MKWISKNGGSTAVALDILKSWASKNKQFTNGTVLDRTLLSLSHSQQTVHDEIFHRMSFWEKTKWLLTRKRL
jgi:hypothetical protein